MKTYLALTIGPIYKTLSTAKKTRELWGGSYLFSYIMKQIILQFKTREFIVPYVKDETIFDASNEVGLFHDRFIFEAENGDYEDLKSVVDEVLISLSSDMKIELAFLKSYLQINIVEKEIKEDDKETNPILRLTPYLDTAELFYTIGQYSENPLTKVLQGGNLFLARDAFGDTKSFPSLPEIALHDMMTPQIKSLINRDDELSIYEKIESKNYHKYYAIVHADGDSMGKVVENLKSKEDFQDFSKRLFEYCRGSHKIIKKFGGETIFAGGDDLLFFAPVVSGSRTVFELCDDISNDFNERFKGTEATLSFGVAIQYHKFPLYEALEVSRGLLFADAKRGKKNSIAFSITKHSGQSFKAIIHKGDRELYENFKLFSSNIGGGEGMDNFLHSLHHKIDSNRETLAQIANSKQMLQNFFDNYFNESGHDVYREFFEQLVDFIMASNSLDDVYATLKFIKFIQGDSV
jgi:CRISPR-associated protein Cmr2